MVGVPTSVSDESESASSPSWRNFAGQSLLAGIAIFFVFTLFGSENLVIVASLGSTAFVVYSMPSRVVASLKNAVCGHTWGVVAGVFCFLLSSLVPGSDTPFFALSVSMAFLGMVLTNTDHPPAAGTALGVAISGIDLLNALEVIAAAALISGSKGPLRGFLRDLR